MSSFHMSQYPNYFVPTTNCDLEIPPTTWAYLPKLLANAIRPCHFILSRILEQIDDTASTPTLRGT